MIYYGFAVIATIFAYLAVHGTVGGRLNENEKYRSKAVYHICILLSFLCYFIPSAIRYGIGQDYFYTYQPMFNYIAKGATSIYTNQVIKYSEIGFTFLNKAIAHFTSDSQWLFVVTAFICLALAYKCIDMYSINIPASVFMMVLGSYYMGSYSLIRQSIAIVLFAYSLQYVKERNLIKYLICILLATLIHTASLVYIPFYFIGNMRMKKKYYAMSTVGIIAGLNILSSLVSKIISLTRFSNRIHFGSEYNILLSIVVTTVFIIALLGYSNDMHDSDESDGMYRIFLNVLFVATCLIGISPFVDTSDRIIFGYFYTNFITIPYIMKKGHFGKYKNVFLIILIIALIALWGYEHLYYDQFSVLPYRTIFNK